MKKKSQVILLAIIAVLAFAAAMAINAQKSGKTEEPGKYDDFAKCLTENGVKMYGAYWCPHCQNQEEMFGSSWKYVNYVECSLPNRAGQTQVCSEAGIKGYPTWEFSDKSRVGGEMTFGQLADKSGCSLNEPGEQSGE
ncbi:hypothetical protein HYU16_02605 [Candidatus Woesearchaeota archaeon]|nr:hypothetical protein [Candidatus Woesearchaeota archaeon]